MESIDWGPILVAALAIGGSIAGAIAGITRIVAKVVDNALDHAKVADKAEQKELNHLRAKVEQLQIIVEGHEVERRSWDEECQHLSEEDTRQKQAISTLEEAYRLEQQDRIRESAQHAAERAHLEERVGWLTTQLELITKQGDQQAKEIAALREELAQARIDKAKLQAQTDAYAELWARLDRWLPQLRDGAAA